MPAWMLDKIDRQVSEFDVGALDTVGGGELTHLVLCTPSKPQMINQDSGPIESIHMGPPLEPKPKKIEAVGTAALDANQVEPGERRKIKTFVDDRLDKRNAQLERLSLLSELERIYTEYVIHPPFLEHDEDLPLWRFSCVGFVLRAYMEARINLLDLGQLPLVPLDYLKANYGRMGKLLNHMEIRKRLRGGEGESWPVALVGHVLNSLARDPDEIRQTPFVPKVGDDRFPKADTKQAPA